MKKKVCRWLDSNELGGLFLDNKNLMSCCSSQATSLLDIGNLDFTTLTGEEIQKSRRALFDGINDGTNESCKGCAQLIEKEENEIDIGAIQFLPLVAFYTCNLRCKYCFKDGRLANKLEEKQTKIFPIIKNFHENGLLKQNFCLGLSGGEPTLMEDIIDTLEFVSKNYQNPELTLFSNASITNRARMLAPDLSKLPKNLNKVLLTSIDAGTPETYKNVRGQDLYYDVINNIINYAKNDSFDVIILKYIFQLDHSNISDEDIFGYLNIVKLISQNYFEKTRIVIDRDCSGKVNECIDDEIIAAAGKIYYVAEKILKLKIELYGSALTTNLPTGKKDLEKIKEYAKNYETKEKSAKESYFLNLLAAKNDKLPETVALLNNSKEKIETLINNNKGKKICLYGAGEFANKVLENFNLSELNILGIIDKNEEKKGTEMCGHKIYSVDDIEALNPEVLVLTVLEKKYCLPAIEKFKTDNNYKFEIIHDLFK